MKPEHPLIYDTGAPRTAALTRHAHTFAACRFSRRTFGFIILGGSVVFPTGCKGTRAESAARAKEHVVVLAKAAATDVSEVRSGLPKGAELVKEYLIAGKYEDATEAREVLDGARNKVQDLRVAKSTFFALVDKNGTVLRSDQEHDALSGKNMLTAFPALKQLPPSKYAEMRGELAEASSVRGRKDGQWLAAVGVGEETQSVGYYVTGWSWSAYAYRLENQLRGLVRSSLGPDGKNPLLYVYVVVHNDVFGAPISPDVNARAVADEKFLAKASGDAVVTAEREITGREFGMAFRRTPELGPDVGIAVVRSET